jgi:ElaB/YqjD/DUF883 family membrane-anchored ribosome-binding protein
MDPSAEIQSNPHVEALIANITQLMNEAEQMLCDSTSQHAEEQIEVLRVRYDNLQTHLASFCAFAGRALADRSRRTDRAIRAHPYESLAIALGVGMLVGALFARRNA